MFPVSRVGLKFHRFHWHLANSSLASSRLPSKAGQAIHWASCLTALSAIKLALSRRKFLQCSLASQNALSKRPNQSGGSSLWPQLGSSFLRPPSSPTMAELAKLAIFSQMQLQQHHNMRRPQWAGRGNVAASLPEKILLLLAN